VAVLAFVGWYALFRKSPDLTGIARTLGKGAAELRQAYREGAASAQAQDKSGEELLHELARRLGMDTQGKSLTQIAEEIFRKST